MAFSKHNFGWRMLLSPPMSKIQPGLLWKQGMKRCEEGRPRGGMRRLGSSTLVKRKFSDLGDTNSFSTEGHASWLFQRHHTGNVGMVNVLGKNGDAVGIYKAISVLIIFSLFLTWAYWQQYELKRTQIFFLKKISIFYNGSQSVFPHLYSLFVSYLL